MLLDHVNVLNCCLLPGDKQTVNKLSPLLPALPDLGSFQIGTQSLPSYACRRLKHAMQETESKYEFI